MGLNLSRGAPIKYYSSDRITQIVETDYLLIDEKHSTKIFSNKEMIFIKTQVIYQRKLLRSQMMKNLEKV